jgi:hypothetical protein
MLYHPGMHEIRPLIESVIDRWPHLRSRATKAEQILLNFDITNSGTCWRVESSEPGKWYSVALNPDRGCGCHDYHAARANVQGYTYCKHIIAISTYVRILAQHLHQRIHGDTSDRNIALRLKHPRNQYLMRLDKSQRVASEDRRVIFRTRYSRDGITCASDADAIEFAHWLYYADRLPEDYQDPERYMLPGLSTKAEHQLLVSGWTREDWNHYMDTGELPTHARLDRLLGIHRNR